MKRHLLAVTVLLIGSAALACNVPVFRYALERWLPDPYDVILFHRGPLTPEQEELLKRFTDAEDQGRSNLRLHRIDLDRQPEEEAARLKQFQPRATLPWLVVRYPELSGNESIVWSGRLDNANVVMLLQSPARKEIIRRLTAGDSAVWVLLESGDPAQDEAAASLATAKLKELPNVLKLPELTDDPADKLETATPLKISFSLLRVSRSDPAEQPFIRMLLNSEDDLEIRRIDPANTASLAGLCALPGPLPALVGWHGQRVRVEPMLFPVFGRGRSLYAWVGKGISEDHIEEDARFLIGPCSCTVKRMNPGFDLLLTADWEDLIRAPITKEEPVPEITRLSAIPPMPPEGSPPAAPESPPPAPAAAAAEPAVDSPTKSDAVPPVPSVPPVTVVRQSTLWRNLLLVGVAGIALLVTATWVLLGKQKATTP